MNLLSHGIDTITLCCSHADYKKDEIKRLYSFFCNVWVSNFYGWTYVGGNTDYVRPGTKPVNFNWLGKIQVKSSISYTTLEFSVASILNGNNSIPISFSDIDNVFKRLENLYTDGRKISLPVDLRKARIKRIDYNFNFASPFSSRTVQDHITSKSTTLGLREITNEKKVRTLKYVSKTRGTLIYSQVTRKYPEHVYEKILALRNQFNANDIIRIEFLLLENHFKKLSPKLQFKDLASDKIQMIIGNQILYTINKLNFENPPTKIGNQAKVFQYRFNKDVRQNDVVLQTMAHIFNHIDYKAVSAELSDIDYIKPYHRSIAMQKINEAYAVYKHIVGACAGKIADLPVIIGRVVENELLS